MVFVSFSVRTRQVKDEISFNDLYNPAGTTPHVNSPFRPGFFVLKVAINETEIIKNVSNKPMNV